MLHWLRSSVGLPRDGSSSEILVWKEFLLRGKPRFSTPPLDFRVPRWNDLGLQHGTVLVVQENPRGQGLLEWLGFFSSGVPLDLPKAPEWLKSRAGPT